MDAFENHFRKAGKINLSAFNRSQRLFCDGYFGEILPVFNLLVVPGERVKISQHDETRMQATVVPFAGNVYEVTRFFSVSLRLLYGAYEKMYMSENSQSDAYFVPHLKFSNVTEWKQFCIYYGQLFSYFGLPVDKTFWEGGRSGAEYPSSISLLPLRAYLRIYFEHFLDRTKFTAAEIDELRQLFVFDSGGDRDYASFIKLEGRMVRGVMDTVDGGSAWTAGKKRGFLEVMHTGDKYSKISLTVNRSGDNVVQGNTLTDLRKNVNLARWYDNLIAAKRDFVNYSLKMFGRAPNTMARESVYLGGSKAPIGVVEVTATSGDFANGQPLGDVAGKGFARSSAFIDYTANEFEIIVGVKYVIYDPVYKGGLEGMLRYRDTFDFPHLEFQSSLYEDVQWANVYPISHSQNPVVIGWQPAYNDWRFGHSRAIGRFATTMKVWIPLFERTVGVKRMSIGTLHDGSGELGYYNEPINFWMTSCSQLFAVPSEPVLFFSCFFKVDSLSPLSHVSQNLNIF